MANAACTYTGRRVASEDSGMAPPASIESAN